MILESYLSCCQSHSHSPTPSASPYSSPSLSSCRSSHKTSHSRGPGPSSYGRSHSSSYSLVQGHNRVPSRSVRQSGSYSKVIILSFTYVLYTKKESHLNSVQLDMLCRKIHVAEESYPNVAVTDSLQFPPETKRENI